MKRGKCLITPELLKDALDLDDGIEVIGIKWDWSRNGAWLFIAGDELPYIFEGDAVPAIDIPTKQDMSNGN